MCGYCHSRIFAEAICFATKYSILNTDTDEGYFLCTLLRSHEDISKKKLNQNNIRYAAARPVVESTKVAYSLHLVALER